MPDGVWSTYIVPLLTPIVGGLVAAAALWQAKTARERHEAQTNADRERRITESFTKAVEQLGSDKVEVRLGGIYTLERLSRESKLDYWPIMETLTAFVRERAPWKDADTALPQKVLGGYDHVSTPHQSSYRVPTDIAAVLTVIMRRNTESREREASEGWKLNLSFTDLRGAILPGAHPERAYLRHTHLEEAYLEKIHLEDADLTGAHLQRANLIYAHLVGATFFKAHLQGANFYDAHLEGAKFPFVEMGAVNLHGAHLHGAHLARARGLTQGHLNGAFGDAETLLPDGLTPPAHWLSKQGGD